MFCYMHNYLIDSQRVVVSRKVGIELSKLTSKKGPIGVHHTVLPLNVWLIFGFRVLNSAFSNFLSKKKWRNDAPFPRFIRP